MASPWRAAVLAAALAIWTAPAAGKSPPGGEWGPAAGKPTTAPAMPADAPWGKEFDGLACRLIVRATCCAGEAVTAVVEIRNVSDKPRKLIGIFDFHYPQFARMDVVAPGGRRLAMNGSATTVAGPQSLVDLAPHAVMRIEFPDLNGYFDRCDRRDPKDWSKGLVRISQFAAPGKYTLRYSWTCRKLPRQVAVGEKMENGKRVKVYQTFDDAAMAAMWEGTLVSNEAAFVVEGISPADLTVHEWGVFTVYNDLKHANADRKAEWGALPEFFYRQFPAQRLKWAPAAWDKPIVYFYTKRPALRVEVAVRFADGAPVTWWPCCERPVDDGMGPRGGGDKRLPLFRELVWDVWLGRVIPATTRHDRGGSWVEVEDYPLPKDCWLKQARLEGASPLTVTGTTMVRSAPWMSNQRETERFLFYDGLVPAPDGLRCTASASGGATFRNAGRFPIADLFVVDHRGRGEGDPVLFAYHAGPIGPGKEAKVALAAVPARKWPLEGSAALRLALLAAGLFEAEADALLGLWRAGLFERPGLSAFHVLPREEYDRMLPMAIAPAPGKLVRVGVALHARLEDEPQLAARARELLRQLDAADFKHRQAAMQELRGTGPVAWRILREALAGKLSEEARSRVQEILDAADATEYLRSAAEAVGVKHPRPPARR